MVTRQARKDVVNALRSRSPWTAARGRPRERERKRQAVILAAAGVFRRLGYHTTSLDDIAAALNVTKPTIYHYVANKEQLLFECFRAGLELIGDALAEARGSKADGRTRLIAVVTGYANAIASEYGWCMVRAEDQDLGPATGRRIKALKGEIDRGLRGLIEAGIRDGSIGACDAKMTAFAIAGALNWIAHWYRDDDSLTPDEIAVRFVSFFESGLRPRGRRHL